MDYDIELVADKAAGITVPAEAVEKVARWLAAQAGWTNPGPWAEFKHRKFYEQRADEVLAAAVPLIVADRDPNVRSLIQLVEQQREALDETAAQVARLTAERDAARLERDTEQEVKIRYRKALMHIASMYGGRGGNIAHTALAGEDTSGGSR